MPKSFKKSNEKAGTTEKSEHQNEQISHKGVLQFEDTLEIHLAQRRILKKDQEIKLTRTEWALLLSLIEQKGGLVEHKTLLENVWGKTYKKEESDYLLYVHIGKLRRKLEVDVTHPRYILTEVGLGYRFAYHNGATLSSRVAANKNTIPAPDNSPASSNFTRLSIPLNSFVGREKQLKEIIALLTRPSIRQLTLTGPGGVGKTRLALEVGRQLESRFQDGVFLVDLSFVNEPELVADAISQILEIKKDETSKLTLVQHLKKYLAERQLLLILDNFEQVLPASKIIEELLENSAQLKILVTSRRALRNYGEHEYNLPPLSVPSTAAGSYTESDLASIEAIRLFVERVQSYNYSFELNNTNAMTVAQICLQLDGLPLAIELAAARTRLVALPVLLNLLTDRFNLLTDGTANIPVRQRTLRTTIDWSYNLLSETGKKLFLALAIFEGNCDFEAVQFICSDETLSPYDLLLELDTLVDQNMLQRVYNENNEPLFRFLKTHRDYALQQMIASGREQFLRSKHFDYYLKLIEQAEPELKKSRQLEWLKRLEAEHNNFRAALLWITGQSGEQAVELALRLGGALGLFWFRRQHLEEGYKWLNIVLDKYTNYSFRSAALAKALQRAAQLISEQPETYELAANYLEKSILIWQELDNKTGQALSLNHLGTLFVYHNRLEAAQQAHERALQLSREIGDTYHANTLLVNLGMIARYRKNFAKARNLFEQCLVAFRELNDYYGIALTLCNLGIIYYDEGHYTQSENTAQQSFEQFEHLGDLNGQAFALHILALAIYRQNTSANIETARSLLMKSLIFRMQIHDKRGISLSLRGLVLVSPPSAIITRLWGASEKLRIDTRLPLFDADIPDYNEALAKAKSDFSSDIFEQLQNEGVLMLETGALFKEMDVTNLALNENK